MSLQKISTHPNLNSQECVLGSPISPPSTDLFPRILDFLAFGDLISPSCVSKKWNLFVSNHQIIRVTTSLTCSLCPGKKVVDFFKEETKKALLNAQNFILNFSEFPKEISVKPQQEDNLFLYLWNSLFSEEKWAFNCNLGNLQEIRKCFHEKFAPYVLTKSVNGPNTTFKSAFPVHIESPEGKVVNEFTYEKSQHGVCSGESIWFANLLSHLIQIKNGQLSEMDLVAIAKEFEAGGGEASLVIQGTPPAYRETLVDLFYGYDHISIPTFTKNKESIIAKIDSLTAGVYELRISCFLENGEHLGHMCVLTKDSTGHLYLFDPSLGLIKLEKEDAGKMISFHADYYYHYISIRSQNRVASTQLSFDPLLRDYNKKTLC